MIENLEIKGYLLKIEDFIKENIFIKITFFELHKYWSTFKSTFDINFTINLLINKNLINF